MEITYKKETIFKKEIAVPSYWRTDYGYYRVYEVDGDPQCDSVHIYHPIKKYDFSINCGFIFNPERIKEISEKEFYDAFTIVKEYMNQITPLPDAEEQRI